MQVTPPQKPGVGDIHLVTLQAHPTVSDWWPGFVVAPSAGPEPVDRALQGVCRGQAHCQMHNEIECSQIEGRG